MYFFPCLYSRCAEEVIERVKCLDDQYQFFQREILIGKETHYIVMNNWAYQNHIEGSISARSISMVPKGTFNWK